MRRKPRKNPMRSIEARDLRPGDVVDVPSFGVQNVVEGPFRSTRGVSFRGISGETIRLSPNEMVRLRDRTWTHDNPGHDMTASINIKYEERVEKSPSGNPDLIWIDRGSPGWKQRDDRGFLLAVIPTTDRKIAFHLRSYEEYESLIRGRYDPETGKVHVKDDELRKSGMSTYMIFMEMTKRAAELGLVKTR